MLSSIAITLACGDNAKAPSGRGDEKDDRANPRLRRRRGDKSRNGKVAVLGVIYSLRKTKGGYEGPINKQVIGTFESHHALMQWLRRQADKRGYRA